MHRRLAIPAIAATLALAACTPAETATTAEAERSSQATTASSVWDSSVLHTFEIDYDPDDYDALMDAYLTAGEKVWIRATVTIDGTTYENAGLKLKGNSSLRGASADSDPADLPWIVRLDKYVDGQSHDGATEFAIRSNSSESSLNEAVALDLLDAAGLAAEEAIAVSLVVEGSDPTLRLVVENPEDAWMERELGDGYLYKAETGGDYTYRGEDESAYDDVFDQEGGDADLTPLIDFLAFINNSDDATFAAELADHLDVDAFATYLAFQELVDNDDDIDGAGNNSYLYYDPSTGLMTVVNWDLNLAFGATPGGQGAIGGGVPGGERPDGTMRGPGGAAGGGIPDGEIPGGGELPALDAGELPHGGIPDGEFPGGGRGGLSRSNVLVERFLANADFAALVDAELERLTEALYASGLADASLDAWTDLLSAEATDLVSAETIEAESAALEARFPG